jgi:hypothetical protein
MIVPLALVSTQRMKSVRTIIEANKCAYYSNFAWRPGKLFDTVNRALTIFISLATEGEALQYATNYIKWNSENRYALFDALGYIQSRNNLSGKTYWIGKLGSEMDNKIVNKVVSSKQKVGSLLTRTGETVYYKTTGGLYWKVFTDFAPKFYINGVEGHSSRETTITVSNNADAVKVLALLSSSAFWWWYTLSSNLRDLNPSDITNFYIPCGWGNIAELYDAGQAYSRSLVENCRWLERNQRTVGLTRVQSFKISISKPEIDKIDSILAQHYGFTDEELDYIINYDIKYRMGIGGATEGGNEE